LTEGLDETCTDSIRGDEIVILFKSSGRTMISPTTTLGTSKDTADGGASKGNESKGEGHGNVFKQQLLTQWI